MRRLVLIATALVVALVLGQLQHREAQAAQSVYFLSAVNSTVFYDMQGNAMGLQLDVEQGRVVGVSVFLNGVWQGYAQPVVQNGGFSHWDARGAHVTLVDGAYAVRLEDLGPWYTEKISDSVNTNIPPPPASTVR